MSQTTPSVESTSGSAGDANIKSTVKLTVEEINSVQRRVSVGLPVAIVTRAFDDAFRSVQKKAKLQGFRPGKAPLTMIKKLYGDSVRQEVGEKLINKHLFDALTAQKINPVAAPVVEKMDVPTIDQEFNFTAIVDVMPVIAVKDWKGLKLEGEIYEETPESITKQLDYMRRRQAKLRALDEGTAAAAGHFASFAYKVYQNGEELHSDGNDLECALGFREISPDLEAAVVGMKAGETKRTTITLPVDFENQSLAGQAVDFEITLKQLQSMAVPELNDEFAKDMGHESVETFIAEVKTQLELHIKQRCRQKLENAIMNQLRASNSFDIPPSIVDQVIDSMIMELNLGEGQDPKKLLRNEEIRKSFREAAKIKAHNTLILWRIAQDEKLEVTDARLQNFVRGNFADADKWDDHKVAEFAKQYKGKIEENLIFELAFEEIIKAATITEKKVAR